MCKRVIALIILVALGPTTALAQNGSDELVFLVPNLFGANGLNVESGALLPSGETHTAHFNSAFQADFTQFNVALATQLVVVPLPSPASGFTYGFDPSLGVFTRSSQSFGPILSDRAETIGKGKFSLGFSFQHFTFDSIDGVDLDGVPAVFTHDDPAPGGKADVVTTVNSIEAKVDQFTWFLTYGLTDRLDVSVAIPIVRTELAVVSNATIQRLGTASNAAVHFFEDAAGGFGNDRQFSASGSASGLGDIVIRLKGTVAKAGATRVALGADLRLPSGDEMDLLGSGATGLRPFAVVSFLYRAVSPHINLGYQWNGDSVLAGDPLTGEKKDLPDQFIYTAGVDIGVSEELTLAFDLLGRRVIDSSQLTPVTFQALDGSSTFEDIQFQEGSFNVTNAAVGFKFNARGALLLDFNIVFKLDDNGIRDRATPLVGLEYSF